MDSPGALNLISFMILIRKSYAATGTLLDKACHVNCGINLTFCPSTLLVVNPRERSIESYSQPIPADSRYEKRIVYGSGESVDVILADFGHVSLAVDDGF